jgi:hypothetical protein
LKRDGFKCQICGRTKDDLDDAGKPVVLHVDHKVAMANDGKSEDDNLWTLCYDCNRGKGDHDVDETYEELKPLPDRAPGPAPKPESTKHLRVLANGAVYDTIKGRIVSSKNVTTKITPERSVEMQSRRQELKREAMIRAANRVAAQGGSVDGSELSGDLAFVEAITEAMTMKALTVNDAKAVDASRFIFQETGIAESRSPETVNNTMNVINVPPEILSAITALHSRLLTETDISVSNNVRIDATPTDDTEAK